MTSVPDKVNGDSNADTERTNRAAGCTGVYLAIIDADANRLPGKQNQATPRTVQDTTLLPARTEPIGAHTPVSRATVNDYLRAHWTAESPKWLSVPLLPERRLQQRRRALLSALNTLPFGVCIVQADLSIVESNREARRILALGDGLRKDGANRLTGNNHAALARAVHRACLAARDQRGAHNTSLLLGRSKVQHPLCVDVMPLRDTFVESIDQFRGAMISIIDPAMAQPISATRISKIYKLSTAETVVCQHLVDGWSNQKIATSRNVSIDTIKTQVRNVMHKTSTSHRCDLIRLAAQLSPALFLLDPP